MFDRIRLLVVQACIAAVLLTASFGTAQPYGQFSVGGSSAESLSSVFQLANGDYLLYCATRSYGAGGKDLLVMRLDSDFDVIWQFAFGGSEDDYTYDRGPILENPDGTIMLLGNTESYGDPSSDILLFKLTQDGDLVWSRVYGGDREERAAFLRHAPSGGYLFGSSSDSYSHPSAEGTERKLHLVKVDASGEVIWSKSYGTVGAQSSGATQIGDILPLEDGTFLIGGYFDEAVSRGNSFCARLDADGAVLWFAIYTGSGSSGHEGFHALSLQDDESFIASGITLDLTSSPGNLDAILVSIDIESGLVNWANVYDVNGQTEWFYRIVKESTNRYVTAMYENGSGSAGYNQGLFAFDGSGQPLEARVIPANSAGKSLQRTQDGGYVIAGSRSEGTNGGSDAFVAIIDQRWNSGCGSPFEVESTPRSIEPIFYSPTEVNESQDSSVKLGFAPVVCGIDVTCDAQVASVDADSRYGQRPGLHLTENPVRSGAPIRFSFRLDATDHLSYGLYDVTGRARLPETEGRYEAGDHEITLSGRNPVGQPLDAGIYFLRMETASRNFTRRVTIIQ